MSSKFDAEFYFRFRPEYPSEVFSGFREALMAAGMPEPFQLADLGCGTGYASHSLLQTGIHAKIVGIDPDVAMLERARDLGVDPAKLRFQVGSAEATGLPDQSVDGILIGSAFHWMDRARTCDEAWRIMRDRGVIRLFEYQFPKSVAFPELDEWIRRGFNVLWKAPNQTPRGSFGELTSVFRQDFRFQFTGEGRPKMSLPLDAEALTGLLISQSRVQHYEATLDPVGKSNFREQTLSQVRKFLGADRAQFDFKLSWIEFKKATKLRGPA